jgi:hypothetical protein
MYRSGRFESGIEGTVSDGRLAKLPRTRPIMHRRAEQMLALCTERLDWVLKLGAYICVHGSRIIVPQIKKKKRYPILLRRQKYSDIL